MGGTLQPVHGHAGLTPAPATAGIDPRLAAFHILCDVDRGEFADRAAARRLAGLAPADRRLAVEMAYGSIRLRDRLDTELADLLDQPIRRLNSRVLQWLRLGLYQLREMRVPDHAAVDQVVRGVKETAPARFSGLANAVLRRATREPRREALFGDPDVEPIRYLTAWGSHPEWLVRRWLERWPLASVRHLVENDNRAPPVTLRLFGGATESGLELEPTPGVRLVGEPGWRGVFRLLEGEPEEALRLLPAVVQDPAAAAVVDYVGTAIDGPVVDLCSAPGGKAMGLANAARAGQLLVAADVSRRRLARVREAADRLGVRVSLVAMDGRAPAVGNAATVLLDAPCTGTGVLRRRPDARWRVDPQRLRSLVELQRELLDAAAVIVRPGGLFVYSTCSLEAEENEEQVDRFLERHRDFEREPPDPLWVREGSTDENGDLRVLPWVWDSDGAFASRLRRVSGPDMGD